MWASCGKNVHADLICVLARLCKEQIVRSVCWPVLSLCPFAGSLNLLGLTQVLSFSFAQHFKNMSMQINTLTVNPTMKEVYNTSFLSQSFLFALEGVIGPNT